MALDAALVRQMAQSRNFFTSSAEYEKFLQQADPLVSALVELTNEDVANSGGLVATYEVELSASGDFGPITDAFFTPASDGYYTFEAFMQSLDANATSGNLLLLVNQAGGPGTLTSFSHSIFGGDGTTDPNYASFGVDNTVLLAAGGAVTVDRSVSGFTGSASGYRAVIKARKVA